jgi:hypothetical protein
MTLRSHRQRSFEMFAFRIAVVVWLFPYILTIQHERHNEAQDVMVEALCA